MRRLAWILAVAAAAAAVFLLLRRGDRREGEPRPPSVLLITLDTTRDDAVGPGKHTPALERFCRDDATRFTGVRAPVPLTLPAHVTILSGLLPPRHGVHENLVPPLPADRGFPLLAEEFRSAGFATAAFVSSAVVGPATGLQAGFDTFEAPVFGDPWSGDQGDVPAPQRAAAALAWLGALPSDRRFFCWVHFFDPHAPYMPFDGDAERPGTREGDAERALYAGEVRRMDAAVGLLLRAVAPDTIVVIASDHGEGLGEHGEPTHGVLCHAPTADVFLAVRGPGLGAGATSEGPRGLADLAPTLRAWCGLPSRPSDGVPLREEVPDRVVLTESLLCWRTYGWGQVFAASDGRFTLVETGPRVEIFDRRADPGESRPLDPAGHPAYERLDRALLAYRSSRGASQALRGAYFDAGSPYGSAVRPLSEYLPRPANAVLADPAEGFPFRAAMTQAKAWIHAGLERRDAALLRRTVELLDGLAAKDPANPAPWLYLVHARGRLGHVTGDTQWHRSAVAAAREAVRLGYRVAPLLHDMLYEALQGGHPDDLREGLETAVAGDIRPDLRCAELAAQAGAALRQAGDGEGAALAVKFLERCAREFPDPGAREAVGELLQGLR